MLPLGGPSVLNREGTKSQCLIIDLNKGECVKMGLRLVKAQPFHGILSGFCLFHEKPK